MSVCLVLCVCRGSKYSEVVPDWLILDSDLYGTIHNCGPLRIQCDDVVVLAVVFFALFSRSIGFQMFGNLKDIPFHIPSPETSPKNTMIQDMINSETIWIQLNRQTQTYSRTS